MFAHRYRQQIALQLRATHCCRQLKHTFANDGNRLQTPPKLLNPASQDPLLMKYVKERCPSEIASVITNDLQHFGGQLASHVNEWGLQCEREPPWLEQYDAWGRRIDRLYTSEAWQRMKPYSAKEGLVAIAYENGKSRGEWNRLHQMLKIYLFGPSGGLYGCPLAMTDGAARVVEMLGTPDSMKDAYQRLTSRNPDQFWTSGQWMTERMGGSDVGSGTETVAYPHSDGSYALHGYKWFSSATDADMSLLLAREIDPSTDSPIMGSKGLSLFYLQLRDPQAYRPLPSGLNGIQVVRLKKKMGTRQLPTAELLLDGARAIKVSETGRGVSSIAGMLQITRLHCISHNVGTMRRMLQLARDYSQKRVAFGSLIGQHPMHVNTLLQMEVDCQASFLGFVHICHLMGRVECGAASGKEASLTRLVTALLKMFTSKQAVSVTSEGLECFGGQGYMEDTGLPNLLRDVHVNCIWEGTTNVICLDALRTVQKSNGEALQTLFHLIRESCHEGGLHWNEMSDMVRALSQEWETFVTNSIFKWSSQELQYHLREIMFGITRLYLASRLLENCRYCETEADSSRRRMVLKEWLRRDLSTNLLKRKVAPPNGSTSLQITNSVDVVMTNYASSDQS